MRAASGDHDALDRSLASEAGFAGAHIDTMLKLEESFFAVGVYVIGDGRATRFNRLVQHIAHGLVKFAQLIACDGIGAAARTDTGAKERFVSVNVADSAEKSLIEQ